MILQALTGLFEELVRRGTLSSPGWSKVRVSYALCLDETGALTGVVPLLVPQESKGKKTVLRPQDKVLPSSVTRSSGILPNFLWDNSSYLLGVDEKGKPARSIECFRACGKLHHQLLDDVDAPEARAILAYFDTWQPEQAAGHPALAQDWQELMKGGNLTFRVNGVFAGEVPQLRAAWDAHYNTAQGERTQCLVTGRQDIPEAVHPAIKGVAGAQSSGAALVSFNAPAFCSYGKEQSLNAPVGKYAAFAYTAALNHLLSDRENLHRIGDTTVVCWAQGAEPQYNAFANFTLFGDPPPASITTDTLRATVTRLAKGLPSPEEDLDPSRPFYILGLAPNAARLSVRFFYRSTFGELMRNVNDHHERMRIVGSFYETIPLWALLRETVNKNTTDKSPSSTMTDATARAIFSGGRYPASLLNAVMLRIRAEREITPGRAAILKAYYLKNPSEQCPKEVLTVSLNPNCTDIPYTLGRLFAVYEAVQESANHGINATIRDKYFNSAASTPAVIFPILNNLCQNHLRKLRRENVGLYNSYEKKIMQLRDILPPALPTRLSLQQQGAFDQGYYHQKQSRYNNKEEKK